MDIFDLFASIKLDSSEYDKGIDDAKGKLSGLGGKLTSGLASAAGTAVKITSAAVAAGATAVGALVTSAIKSYADYEQLVGGVETLFKDSADTVMQYANNAYKTAGLSANEYMETVTSFSASLLQGLGGDTAEAARVADMAITDMADNSAKMGTSMEAIQNAYQGFAKQNYTMLDNLKLGYGGTKTEMERLLADAQKLSGVEYNIDNLNDVYEAIHIIQGEMGITGTTAKEAATTISGSIDMMKSSWANLITGIADDNADFDTLITNFVDSVATVGGNVIPIVEQALVGVGTLIETLLPVVMKEIPTIINGVIPELLESGVNIVTTILQGISDSMPEIVQGAISIMNTLIQTILDNLPLLIETALNMITQLAMGIAQALPELIPTIVDVVLTVAETLINNVDLLIDASIALIVGLAEGLINALPILIEKVPETILKLVDAIINNAPKLVTAAIQLVSSLTKGIVTNWATLISQIPSLVVRIVSTISNLGSQMRNAGINLVSGLWNGFKDNWNNLVNNVKNMASNLISSVKGIFGIHSPSKVFSQIGEYCVEGFNAGMSDLMDSKEITKNINAGINDIQNKVGLSGFTNTVSNGIINNEDKININITLAGDADGIFRVVRQETQKYYNSTGRNALVY